jgi:hypothetical protein
MKDLEEIMKELNLYENDFFILTENDIYRNEILEDINEWLNEETEIQDRLETFLRNKKSE